MICYHLRGGWSGESKRGKGGPGVDDNPTANDKPTANPVFREQPVVHLPTLLGPGFSKVVNMTPEGHSRLIRQNDADTSDLA
ncbi:hypothetical protein Poly41_14490 [Novipirellula artificiosorum]|uniref:Uncharacterized protein n=1 Tax=Novipirellula artificiosorum TaxID=2528016 RepID=A0A5C6DW88_9BACT|nr:hypothetical protein Poly41_14490 [Novipirellula artificiosorum]